MSLSMRRLSESKSSILSIGAKLEIPKFIQKTSKERTERQDEKPVQSSAEIRAALKSWRDRKRLYPPFRQRQEGHHVPPDKDDPYRTQTIDKKRHPIEPEEIRLSVCMTKNQLPFIVCTDIPINRDGKFQLRKSDSNLYSTFGGGGGDKIPKACGPDDESCWTHFHGRNIEDEFCQNVRCDSRKNGSEDLADSHHRREPRHHMTVCGESVDYVICKSEEPSTSQFDSERKTSYEELGEEKDFNFLEYEKHQRSVSSSEQESEWKSETEAELESELFQDPLVSHSLKIPYKEMPPSRYSVGGLFNNSLGAKSIAKRPQSPVKNILGGRFDVQAGIARVMEDTEVHNARHTLRKPHQKLTEGTITSDLKSLSLTPNTSVEPLTTFLKVLLHDVQFSLATGGTGIEFTSATLTTVWKICESVKTETGFEAMQSVTITSLGAFPISERSLPRNMEGLESTRLEQGLNTGYIRSGGGNELLHRIGPWTYLCAAHAEGQPENYSTLRAFIDKVTAANRSDRSRGVDFPGVSCVHFKDILFRSPVSLGNDSGNPVDERE